jgi:hypothetical protein
MIHLPANVRSGKPTCSEPPAIAAHAIGGTCDCGTFAPGHNINSIGAAAQIVARLAAHDPGRNRISIEFPWRIAAPLGHSIVPD